MLLEARTTEDFYRVLEPAYESLLEAQESSVFEVVLAPGVYEGFSLNLSDRREKGHVALIVRAADPANPPIFRDAGVKLSGREVWLAGIVFQETQSNMPLVSIRTPGDLTIDGCAFLECVYDG